VFGARAAQAMLLPGEQAAPFSMLGDDGGEAMATATGLPHEHDVRTVMWNAVGLWRTRDELRQAADALDGWYAALGANRTGVAAIKRPTVTMARAALRREETRGSHARADFPSRDDVKFRIHLGDSIH
jgi:L-aspartate oxidase